VLICPAADVSDRAGRAAAAVRYVTDPPTDPTCADFSLDTHTYQSPKTTSVPPYPVPPPHVERPTDPRQPRARIAYLPLFRLHLCTSRRRSRRSEAINKGREGDGGYTQAARHAHRQGRTGKSDASRAGRRRRLQPQRSDQHPVELVCPARDLSFVHTDRQPAAAYVLELVKRARGLRARPQRIERSQWSRWRCGLQCAGAVGADTS